MGRASRIINTNPTQNVETQVLGPNPRRVCLLFTVDVATCFVRTDPLGNVVGGIVVGSGGGPVKLTRETHGEIVTRPILAFSAAATTNLGIMETLH